MVLGICVPGSLAQQRHLVVRTLISRSCIFHKKQKTESGLGHPVWVRWEPLTVTPFCGDPRDLSSVVQEGKPSKRHSPILLPMSVVRVYKHRANSAVTRRHRVMSQPQLLGGSKEPVQLPPKDHLSA